MINARYYINTVNRNQDAYQIAAEFAVIRAKKDPKNGPIVLLSRFSKRLVDFKKIRYINICFDWFEMRRCRKLGPYIMAESLADYDSGVTSAKTIIACGFDTQGLFEIERECGAVDIIAVPDSLLAIEEWVKIWGPTEITSARAVIKPYPELSNIGRFALKEFHEQMASNLEDEIDMKRVEFYLRALVKYEPSLAGKNVKAHLIRHHSWLEKNANLAQQYVDFLNYNYSGGTLEDPELSIYYWRWRREARLQGCLMPLVGSSK